MAARSTLEATVLCAAATPEGVTAETLRTAAAETRADRAHRDTDPPGEPTPLGELVLASRAEVVDVERAKTRYAVEALRARLVLAEAVCEAVVTDFDACPFCGAARTGEIGTGAHYDACPLGEWEEATRDERM